MSQPHALKNHIDEPHDSLQQFGRPTALRGPYGALKQRLAAAHLCPPRHLASRMKFGLRVWSTACRMQGVVAAGILLISGSGQQVSLCCRRYLD